MENTPRLMVAKLELLCLPKRKADTILSVLESVESVNHGPRVASPGEGPMAENSGVCGVGAEMLKSPFQKITPAKISISLRFEPTAESRTPKLRSIHRVNRTSGSMRILWNRN